MYGDLSMADGEYGGAKGRRWKLDWDRTPQPVQIKLKCLRGIKDKLPGERLIHPFIYIEGMLIKHKISCLGVCT